jgi:hypothetical protein
MEVVVVVLLERPTRCVLRLVCLGHVLSLLVRTLIVINGEGARYSQI